MTGPLVKNAASERQVKRAKNKESLANKNITSAMRAVLSSDHGVEVMWHILGHCGTFNSIWHASALIHYNSGKQDVGHWLMAEINDANPKALLKIMERNSQESAKESD